MEWMEKEFGNGVKDCWRVWEDDTRRNNSATEELARAPNAVRVKIIQDAVADTKIPLWQRVSGLTSLAAERAMRPMLRRERIRRLLKVVDQILRAELKTPACSENDPAAMKASVEELKRERSVFWDPLPEVCFYLEIGQSKLAQYSRQLTGLGAKDLVDRIRVEKLRASIRERLRKVVGLAQANSKEDVKRLSVRDGAGVLLKALKVSEHFVSRQQMALEVGIASKARLYRACLACERKTLEEIEWEEAGVVFGEMREREVVPPVPLADVVPDGAGAGSVPAQVAGVKTD